MYRSIVTGTRGTGTGGPVHTGLQSSATRDASSREGKRDRGRMLCARPKSPRIKVDALEDVAFTLQQGAHKNSGMLSFDSGRWTGHNDTCTAAVPRLFHFIWLGTELPAKYRDRIKGMMSINPGWDGFLWVDTIVSQPHPSVVMQDWKAVNRTKPFVNADLIAREENLAGKSDYLRLEVVYRYGGVYVDTDVMALRPLDEFGALFQWPIVTWTETHKNLCNCMFSFPQKSPFLRFALNAARENCVRFDACGVLNGAGPSFLTGAIMSYRPQNVLFVHQRYLVLKSGNSSDSVMYQTFDETWIRKVVRAKGRSRVHVREVRGGSE